MKTLKVTNRTDLTKPTQTNLAYVTKPIQSNLTELT